MIFVKEGRGREEREGRPCVSLSLSGLEMLSTPASFILLRLYVLIWYVMWGCWCFFFNRSWNWVFMMSWRNIRPVKRQKNISWGNIEHTMYFRMFLLEAKKVILYLYYFFEGDIPSVGGPTSCDTDLVSSIVNSRKHFDSRNSWGGYNTVCKSWHKNCFFFFKF